MLVQQQVNSISEDEKVILVTGGAGYIGSHTVLELLKLPNYRVVVVDNLSNSSEESLKRVSEMTGKSVEFFKVDLLNISELRNVLQSFQKSDGTSFISDVIHFAGLKAVGESWEVPLSYYECNITGTLNLLKVMKEFRINNIIFSSSATVYGITEPKLLLETESKMPISPYGRTKAFIEEIIQDVVKSTPSMQAVILRYFNPVGADRSGQIGEDPRDVPNNLMPFVAQVAIGKRPILRVFGDDYETRDGTGMRDYIHVTDLALGHVAALKKLQSNAASSDEDRTFIYNLGTGEGTTVLEIRETFSRINNVQVPFEIVARRPGDVAFYVADPTKAQTELKWQAKMDLESMCRDLWRWQQSNPSGYNSTQ